MQEYEAAKARLLTELLPASEKGRPVAVLNVDDPAVEGHTGDWQPCLRVSCRVGANADVAPVDPPAFSLEGIRCRVGTPDGVVPLNSALLGAHNLSNLLLAGGIALAVGLSLDALRAGWERAQAAPGRMERVQRSDGRGPLVVVDYAHSPDALTTALASLRPFVPGRLVTVFGCGGDRDVGKRPLMAAAAWAGSDAIVMTSDNPRSEEPDAILDDMEPGLPGGLTPATALADLDTTPITRIADRRDAIRAAIAAAGTGDLVLVAGKGHEMTQDTNGRSVHFDDREEARQALAEFHAPANEPPRGFSKHGRTVKPFPTPDDDQR
jgi:UDP-N-acetylmuramyl-tripeptide synthetase